MTFLVQWVSWHLPLKDPNCLHLGMQPMPLAVNILEFAKEKGTWVLAIWVYHHIFILLSRVQPCLVPASLDFWLFNFSSSKTLVFYAWVDAERTYGSHNFLYIFSNSPVVNHLNLCFPISLEFTTPETALTLFSFSMSLTNSFLSMTTFTLLHK